MLNIVRAGYNKTIKRPHLTLNKNDMTKQSSHASQGSKTKVIAAIPCFNTKRSIEDIVSRARKYVDQVIAIDDGSQDGTAEVARAAGALVISHDRNMGYGKAIMSCFEAARQNAADVLVILDGDGQHNPDEIPKLSAPVLRGEADLVIGSRFLGSETNMPGYRKFGIKVITFLFNFSSQTRVSDAQSGFRSYHKKLFSDFILTEEGMNISIETLEKARSRGTIIKEVSVGCQYEPSTLNLKATRHGLGVALAVIKIRLKSLGQRLIGHQP